MSICNLREIKKQAGKFPSLFLSTLTTLAY
jgi:hypothetical protein